MGLALPQLAPASEDRASGAQVIDGSLKFNSADNASLTKALSSDGNLKKWTWSGWIKRGKLGENQEFFGVDTGTSAQHLIKFDSSDRIHFYRYASSYHFRRQTTQVFRDPSAWFHLVVVYDTDNSTPADRAILYVNGVRITSYSSSTDPTSGETGYINDATYTQGIGVAPSVSTEFDGSLSNINFIDGQALDASYFGYTDGLTNTWRPKKYEGTFGTNGFYLPFDGNSPIGEDKSGKGNNWTPVNFGGSVALDNPIVSGARPILNTGTGGTNATVGVFGSKENQFVTVTVASKTGGGNAYFFGGVERDSLATLRGTTITFDTTDSTNNTHPFKLSSTNADSSGGTEYTDGVAYYINGSVVSGSDYVTNYSSGAASGFRGIKWTVPHNVSTTYYYCTVHNGMGEGGRLTSTTDETKADPYAWKNVISLPLVGANSDVSNSVNSGSTTKVMTSVGNAAASSDTSNFYNGSFEFDGSGDGITCPDNTDFEFGSGDFTVECWVKQDDTSGFDVFVGKYGGSGDGEFIVGKNGNTPTFYWQDAGGNANINATNFTGNTSSWYHMACVREGNVFTMYINGICENSTTDATTIKTTSNKLTIGIENDSSSSPFDGYLQDVRIYKGVAKYSGTTVGTQYFVPASTSPDILPDTPSGVSGGSKLAKVTDGAVSFDGTGDNLTAGQSEDYNFGTDSWTIECFAYFNNITSSQDITDFTNNASATGSPGGQFYFSSSGGGTLQWYESSTAYAAAAGKITPKRWHHLAVVKNSSGDTIKIYIDGKEGGSSSHTESSGTNAGSLRIGLQGSTYFNGFLSNLRILKGTALYTANFTPPTRELTNVTNTKLLCCQSNLTSGAAAVSPNISGSINNGRVWRSLVTGPTRKEDRVANAFNGSTSGPGAIPAYPGTLTFAPGLTSISSVKIYGYYAGSGVTLHVNGSAQSPSAGAFTLTISTSTLDSVVWTATNGFNYMRIDAIEVDSTVLIDPVVGPDDSNEVATNFNPFNTDINTVRGQETGYCTFNVLRERTAGYNPTFEDGNLFMDGRGDGTGTLSAQSGKFYFEVLIDTVTTSDQIYLGVQNAAYSGTERNWGNDNIAAIRDTGVFYGTGMTGTAGTYTAGDTLSFAFDVDNNKLYIAKNGVYFNSGVPSQGTGFTHSGIDFAGGYTPIVSDGQTGQKYRLNCGQKPFKYAPPAGFQPLNAANVRPVKVFARSDQYVGVATYTSGNGSAVSINSYNFAPDLIFIKDRDASNNWSVFDKVRGYANRLDTTGTGGTQDWSDYFGSFDPNGFTVKAATSDLNRSTNKMCSWGWKAGGNAGTFNKDGVAYASAAAAGLTGGALTVSSCSVGTKQGFSIIKYNSGSTGTNNTLVSHGLGKTPRFIIHKTLSTGDWYVYHADVITDLSYYLRLNSGDERKTAGANIWGSTPPNSNTFGVRVGNADANPKEGIIKTNEDAISYVWADVPGLQKFGSYIGKSARNFVELGFRPALIMLKNSSNGSYTSYTYFAIFDSTRDTHNTMQNVIFPGKSQEENKRGNGGSMSSVADFSLDFLSNGFALRDNGASEINLSGNTYIYAAWAEAPTFNLYGAQSNAR